VPFAPPQSVSAAQQALFDAKADKSTLTTKGDLYVATASGLLVRQGVGPNGKALMGDSGQSSGLGYGVPRNGSIGPADYGLIAWSVDPLSATSGSALTSGTGKTVLLYVPYATTITNILLEITTAGTSLTAGQSFAALYDVNGNLLRQTVDQSAAFASTGTKTMALATSYAMTAPGLVKVMIWSVFGGTAPQYARAGSINASATLFGRTSAPYRTSTADTGLTTTAPSTMGAETASSLVVPLVGLS
jgi:hypothetical protein